MAINTKEKQKLKRFIRSLEKIRGRHTELVSVYIPAGYEMIKIIQHLQQEQGTASNIKDKTTQQHVIDSLERMIRHLRLFKKTPETGLAIFSGNISDKEGKSDIQVFSIEPPLPLRMRLYRCDQTFVLDIIRDMADIKETFGLIVLDKREANIGLLKGTQIQELTDMTSAVPGKTRAGGQCLDPETAVLLDDGQWISLEELEKGDMVMSYDFATKEFHSSEVLDKWEVTKDKVYKITAGEEMVVSSADHVFFLEDGTEKAAEELEVGMNLLNEEGQGTCIKKIIVEEKNISLIDIKVAQENFVAGGIVVHNSAQRFARIREEATKEFFNRISEAANKAFLEIKELKGILVGGPGMTKNSFLTEGFLNEQLKRKVISIQDLSYTGEFGLRELVEKSKDVLAKEAITEEREIMNKFFKLLATEPNKVAYGTNEVEKALKMGAVDKLLVSEKLEDDKAEEYEQKAEASGAEFIMISTDTSEGEQLRDLGKVAAILRFSLG
ncbi:MAG: polymorphic toxin-type HINT domain-containing protein [bacterium]|nr:polymorphic toxin-type HINT domain-containing protein [bacterium]